MYSSAADVKMIINTGLADASITELIAIADARLDQKLAGTSLSTALKKDCSMMLTAVRIAQRDPKSYTVGEARVDMEDRIKLWLNEVESIISDGKAAESNRAIVVTSSFQHIDEDERYTQ